jgi:hypothetical protein
MTEKIRDIDDIPNHEFFIELVKFFGPERAIGLIGWAALFCIAGVWDGASLRKQLEEQGFKKSAIYNALADIRRFGEFMEAGGSSTGTRSDQAVVAMRVSKKLSSLPIS